MHVMKIKTGHQPKDVDKLVERANAFVLILIVADGLYTARVVFSEQDGVVQ